MKQVSISLKQLLADLVCEPLPDLVITGLNNDSRALQTGDLWLAGRGVQQHALDFYRPDLPAAAIAYEPPYATLPDDPRLIAVEGLSEKISLIAGRFYDHPSREVDLIGVTGTDGKSSTVHFLSQILGGAMIGTLGCGRLGALHDCGNTTPSPLFLQKFIREQCDAGVGTVSMEVSSHALAQHRVDALHYRLAAFSNLSRDHLDYHRDMEAYFQAKARLFHFPDLADAVIHTDDPYGLRLAQELHKETRLWAYGRQRGAFKAAHVLRCEEEEALEDGMRLRFSLDGRSFSFQTPLLAHFNVDNLLAVTACAAALGMSFEELPAALSALRGVPGRVQCLRLHNGAKALIDYAHTPKALESVLRGIRPHIRGTLWVIYGCGGDRDRGKRPLMSRAALSYADRAVLTDDNPRTEDPQHIIADAIADLSAEERQRLQIIQPRQSAIEQTLTRLAPQDALVVAGKGHENYQLIGTVKHHYSDYEVIAAWIQS